MGAVGLERAQWTAEVDTDGVPWYWAGGVPVMILGVEVPGATTTHHP